MPKVTDNQVDIKVEAMAAALAKACGSMGVTMRQATESMFKFGQAVSERVVYPLEDGVDRRDWYFKTMAEENDRKVRDAHKLPKHLVEEPRPPRTIFDRIPRRIRRGVP